MVGAIVGDVIGSIYQFEGLKIKNFDLFTGFNEITDDSILTMAIFSALEQCEGNEPKLSTIAAKEMIRFYTKYPNLMGGYGGLFVDWVYRSLKNYRIQPAYNSYGNGAAMRISSVAYFAKSLKHCKELSRKVTEITHNHPKGIKGAEATSVAIYMALHGKSREEIKNYVERHYYQLDKSCDEIRKTYQFEPSCQKTVPQSLQAFFESTDYEDAIRTTISLGGDADTMGAITGAVAEAYYGMPKWIEAKMLKCLDSHSKVIVQRMILKREGIKNKGSKAISIEKEKSSNSKYKRKDKGDGSI